MTASLAFPTRPCAHKGEHARHLGMDVLYSRPFPNPSRPSSLWPPRLPFPMPHQATRIAWAVFVSRPSRRLKFLAALTTSSLVRKSPRDHSCTGLSPYCTSPT